MKRMILLLLCCFILLAGCQSTASNEAVETPEPELEAEAPEEPAPQEQPEASEEPEEPEEDLSWDYILEKGELIVGLDDTFAPMGFREEDGSLVGFDIDLATAVGEYLGVKVTFQPIDWNAKEMELATKKIDCIWNGMSITPDREENMSLTRGYLNNRIVILSVPGVEVGDKEDLAELRVGTQADSSALHMVEADPVYDRLKDLREYGTYDEVIMDMDAGRIDVMIVDEVLGNYKNSRRSEPFVQAGVDFGDDLYAVGFRKEDAALTKQVEAAIDALVENGEAGEISNKWFGTDIVLKP